MEPDIPRYMVHNALFDRESIFLVIMSHSTRFNIELYSADLEETEPGREYKRLIGRLDPVTLSFEEYENQEELERWVLEPCFPIFRNVRVDEEEERTLEGFFNGPVQLLRLGVVDGELRARRIVGERFGMDWSDEFPTWLTFSAEKAFEYDQYESLPRFDAGEVKLLKEHAYQDTSCDMPRKVQLADGSIKEFKRPFSPEDLGRELDTAADMIDDSLYEHTRVQRVYGIAVSSGQSRVYGILLDWIPSPSSLSYGDFHNPELRSMTIHHEKWGAQIQSTLQTLHAHEIIWGEVSLSNLFVDENYDVWIKGFGNSYQIGLVDHGKRGTMDGDWQAFRNIFGKYFKGLEPIADEGPYRRRHKNGDGDDVSEAGSVKSGDSR